MSWQGIRERDVESTVEFDFKTEDSVMGSESIKGVSGPIKGDNGLLTKVKMRCHVNCQRLLLL
jgi:hypothetical protein